MDNPVVSGPVHGFNILWFAELDSTNDEALRRMTGQNLPSEFVVRAAYQTHGRGQGTNVWLSPPGENLLFSAVFYPHHLAAQQTFILNQMITVAAHKMVSKYLPACRLLLKWPNDLWVDQQKLGGILVQTSIFGHFVKYAVAGLGLNVHVQHFPSAVIQATSMFLLTGKTYSLDELLGNFLAELRSLLTDLERNETGHLKSYYLQYLLGWQQVNFYSTPTEILFPARFIGIDDHGQMILETKQGKKTFQHQQIKYIRPAE